MQFLAYQAKQKLSEATSVAATVGIGRRGDGKGFALSTALVVDLREIDREVAVSLVHEAHLACPCSDLARMAQTSASLSPDRASLRTIARKATNPAEGLRRPG